jgi:glycosyltransferase involved in cell wall biosynthesis
MRVAIVVSHPIQHFVPFYRRLAKVSDLTTKVFYGSRISVGSYRDPEFGINVAWDCDLLKGYESEFLPGAEEVKSTSFWELRKAKIRLSLASFQPDVVLVYGYGTMLGMKALYWCYRRRVPSLLIGDSEQLRTRQRFKKVIKNLVLPSLFKRVSGFLCVGDHNEAYYQSFGVSREKLFRCPFTIDEELFQSVRQRRQEVRNRVRRELGIPDDAFVALFVGKIYTEKRPADLIHAIHRLAVRNGIARPAYGVFAGDGPLRTVLEEAARDGNGNFVFLGFVNLTKLPEAYAMSDVLVHPSERDAHPLCTCEAAYMGLPLIVSDRVGSCGPTDTARAGENAIIYPCGDVDQLAEAIDRLRRDQTLFPRMADDSLRIADEMGIEASVEGFLNAVKSASPKVCLTSAL